ncbi:response regulator [Prauserella alba]|uniref:Transcriptional regulatory protein n=1 Tax=Prauserella alba TaxID=176898 RepID=A0ABP4G515_9PSEU|nr:response regulator [Prauserella alba]MCP2181960.1 Response regulator of citrate/malate metabolism [Prauserella alba]
MIRVLVVDDDFRVARIHEKFVERTPGFEVAGTAHTGREALDLAASLQPDLLLLDVHLPDMSGLDVLNRLGGEGHPIAVVMVTAEAGAAAVRAALHGGAMQYLVKPFEYDDLAVRLQRVADAMAALPTDRQREEVAQATIDQAFGIGHAPADRGAAALPKGLSQETADLVLTVARERGDISASEAAEAVGLARVTARRYLEHFAATGTAEIRPQYGTSGRPVRRYRIQ